MLSPFYRHLLVLSLFLPLSALAAPQGEVLYQRLCSSCHGFDGEGRSGLAPALVDSKLVQGEQAALNEVVLNGREDTLMVAFRRNLSAAELAAVITYVRQRFGGDPEALIEAGDLRGMLQ